MSSSSNSFWSDIKTYEERLKSDPASYCFAALAEVYLKAGLIDDAVSVARAGVARYPAFVAGQMALARACDRKGLTDESLNALCTVTSAVPESAEAQQMLASACRAAGRYSEAAQALRTLLEFNPDDRAARLELDALEQSGQVSSPDVEEDLELIELGDDDLILDLLEDVSEVEDELVERATPPIAASADPWAFSLDDEPVSSSPSSDAGVEDAEEDEPVQQDGGLPDDPMVTATVAELYLSQGHPEKAQDIYRTLVARDPADAGAAARLAELENQMILESAASSAVTAPPADLPVTAIADQGGAVAVLEGWLDNIRRLRACR